MRRMSIRTYSAGNLIRDVLLNLEDFSLIAIVGLRPNVVPASCVVQLDGDPNLFVLPSHAALNNRPDVQLLRNRTNVVRLPLELEGSCARDHAHSVEVGQ